MNSQEWDKIAPKYFKNILSPFEKGVNNPIFSLIKQFANKDKTVIEIGCGTGTLIPFLSKYFKSVYAFDFSEKMIEISREKFEDLANVDINQQDVLKLDEIKQNFDVAVAVNSIIMPEIDSINKSLELIHSKLNEDGIFIGVFPSLECALYEAMINYEKEFEKTKNHELAVKKTNEIISRENYDFCYGLINFDGKQKHFYQFELMHKLQKAGFKDISIGKIIYPREVAEGKRSAKKFKDDLYKDPWDWTVVARK